MTAARQNIKETGLAGAVKLVVKTFLEQKHYQQLHNYLSEEWSHCHSLTAAVRLMEAHGVYVSPEEEGRLAQLPEDRMIDALVMRMPQQSREQFEHFFLQLSLIASTTTRLRAALEAGNSDAVEEVMDSAENVGILQFILKMAVAQAGQEVKAHEQDHNDWLAVTTDRLAPLLQSQANAAISNKALEAAKAELTHHHATANEKSKKMLMSIAGNSGQALLAMSFHEWKELIVNMKHEAEIRKEYEEEINQANQRLQDYVMQQTKIMKNMINKQHESSKGGIVGQCYAALLDELNLKNDRIAKEEEMKALEAKMANFSAEQSAKSKKVLGRLNAGSDVGLMTLCYQAWVQFIAEYNKNKAFEDAVKAEEQKIAEFMKKQNEGAKSVLTRMSAATESGLIAEVFKAWVEVFVEHKKAMEMEDLMMQNAGKFGSFAARNKGAAGSAMDRAAAAAEESTCIVIFWYWKRETRVERMRRYAKDKNMKKKQQLVGVKGLFKNFANELEAGLKEGTPRIEGGSPAKRSGRGGPEAA